MLSMGQIGLPELPQIMAPFRSMIVERNAIWMLSAPALCGAPGGHVSYFQVHVDKPFMLKMVVSIGMTEPSIIHQNIIILRLLRRLLRLLLQLLPLLLPLILLLTEADRKGAQKLLPLLRLKRNYWSKKVTSKTKAFLMNDMCHFMNEYSSIPLVIRTYWIGIWISRPIA